MRITLVENAKARAAAEDAPPLLFDRPRLAERLGTAGGEGNFITDLVAEDLSDRLAPIQRRFEKAAILGPLPGALPARLGHPEGEIGFARFATFAGLSDLPVCDPEALRLPANDYDLIVSFLDLQTVNDVPGYLTRLRRHLRSDGLLLAAAIGGRTLTELRAAWAEADANSEGDFVPRVAPFMDVRDAGGLLQRAGFALPVTDVESHKVRYADPLALMREIKAMGAANPLTGRPRRLLGKARFARAVAAYPQDADGRVSASLDVVWLSGWAPHESQQQPLAPGSAQVSLSCVLGDKS